MATRVSTALLRLPFLLLLPCLLAPAACDRQGPAAPPQAHRAAVVDRLAPPPDAGALATLVPGAPPLGGTIDPAGDVDVHEFAASAGEVLSVRLAVTGTLSGCFTPRVQLRRRSTGTVLADTYSGSCGTKELILPTPPTALPASDTYEVWVSQYDSFGAGTGTYNLLLLKLSNGTGTPTAYYDFRQDTITIVGDARRYTLTGGVGDIVSIRLAGAGTISGCFTPRVELYAPTGALVGEATSATCGATEVILPVTLPAAGTYLIVESARLALGTGRVNLAPLRLSNASGTSLAHYALKKDEIPKSKLGFVDRYTFTGTAGDVFSIRLASRGTSSGCWNALIELYTPAGTRVPATYSIPSCGATEAIFPDPRFSSGITLPASGKYLILVSDYGANGASKYSLTLLRLTDPAGTPIVRPEVRRDSIKSILQTRKYIYSATQSQVLTIRVVETADLSGCFNARVEIYDVAGSLVTRQAAAACGTNQVTFGASIQSGKYLILVSDAGSDGTGRYELTIS